LERHLPIEKRHGTTGTEVRTIKERAAAVFGITIPS